MCVYMCEEDILEQQQRYTCNFTAKYEDDKSK